MPTIITVQGSFTAWYPAERATARLTVSFDGAEREAVLASATRSVQTVTDSITALHDPDAGPVTWFSSDRIRVWAERPWNNEGKQLALVHYASVEITATFSDFAVMSWWLTDVAERDGVQVDTVTWRLTPATSKAAESEVAAQAVGVAVDRATAYAAALGLANLTPLEIADVGLLSRSSDSPAPAPKMMRAMAMSMDAGSAPAVELQPEDIVVTAAVEARFVAR